MPPDWVETVTADGLSAARRCSQQPSTRKQPHGQPPRVAFCLSGAARAFSSPLVLSALRANLIAPLAGADPEASGSKLFLSLKLSDSAKANVGGVSFGQHKTQAAPLLVANTVRGNAGGGIISSFLAASLS